MDTAPTRTHISFRLNTALFQKLRIEAKKQNRSLNNMVESILMDFIAHKPNEATLAAMHEAETSEHLETLDVKNFREVL